VYADLDFWLAPLKNVDSGLSPFDAFHAALSAERIVSSDGAYDDLGGLTRVRLDPDE
jgi:predicted nucleic acid-binding protein